MASSVRAGVTAEAIAIGNIADQNLARNSTDRQLLARFSSLPLEDFIEDAKLIVDANKEIHRQIAEYFERRFWSWIQTHPDPPDGMFIVMNKAEMHAMFLEVKKLAP